MCMHKNSAAFVRAQKYFIDHPGFLATIRTFGFGYGLDSSIMLQASTLACGGGSGSTHTRTDTHTHTHARTQVARAGGGTFAFVPTAPVMGNVFVHAIANALSMTTPACTVTLAAAGGAKFVGLVGSEEHVLEKWRSGPVGLPGNVVADKHAWGLNVPLGPLQVCVRAGGGGWRLTAALHVCRVRAGRPVARPRVQDEPPGRRAGGQVRERHR